MTVATWPTSLPKPTRAGYDGQRIDTRRGRQSDFAIGYKRRFSQAPKPVTLTIEVERYLKGVFDDFYDRDVKGGTLPFWMPDPTLDNFPLRTDTFEVLSQASDEPLLIAARWLCLFGRETPTERIVGARYSIAFSVLVLP